MTEPLRVSFPVLLKQERTAAGLTQEELAEATGISERGISDLERGLVTKPRKETVRRLADGLNLDAAARARFEAAARGPVPAGGSPAAADRRSDSDPQAWFGRVVAALDETGGAAARAVAGEWRSSATVDDTWLTWVEGLIRLTGEGRLPTAAPRPPAAAHWPPPAARAGSFYGRDAEKAVLASFLGRVRQGRGGVALVLGPAGIGKSRLLVEVLADQPDGFRLEWVALDRREAGYRGWRRLLAPLWISLRRGELAPADVVRHGEILDDILLVDSDSELTGRPFPGEVAAAVAALLDHAAARQPLVLVIDDAHRGGASSDELLLDVARRVSARGVGIIAALRQDELEENSPVRPYGDQADGRAAPDVVVPIHISPLDPRATADLIRDLAGAEPPPEIVEQMLRQTGGRPQLIDNTRIQAPAGSSSWVVGKLGARGLRVLESTIQTRPDAVCEILYAAALCAAGGYIDVGLVARITGQATDHVERILDEECQRGSILTAGAVTGYRFQHDNWIDALIGFCPPDRLRTLHSRCLDLMRGGPAPDPQRIAWHALGAGVRLVGDATLAILARQAADQAFADYAYGTAAEFYAAAAQHSAGTDHIDLLIGQADALRFGGRWDEARPVLRSAASLARRLELPGHEALALIHLERLTWSYGLHENEMTQQIREVIGRLPPDEVVLRAQARAALALRLSIAERQYESEQADLAKAALRDLPAIPDSLVRGDILLGVRGGLQDSVPPSELLDYDKKVLELGIRFRSAFHINESLAVRAIDLIRAGRLPQLAPAVRAYHDFTEQNPAPVVIYGQALMDATLSLARGDFQAARQHTAEADALSKSWGESMAQEALIAQTGWLLYETGEVKGLSEILAAIPGQAVSTLNLHLWSLAAGLIEAEQGDIDSAGRAFREVAESTGDFSDLPRGPSRIAILGTAAMVLGHPLLEDALPSEDTHRWARSLADLLARHQDVLVLAGWPAVLLGSKHRFIGLAHLAARQQARAVTHLARGVSESMEFKALHTRARFDLARALLRQQTTYAQGMAEMRQVQRSAGDLGMKNLVVQTAAELDRRPG